MIDLYTWPTPNGHKIHIMLEECGLPYNVIPIDIGAGDQFNPEFLKISPNNKMPAMVDPDGPDGKPIAMFESGAILIYLAEKTGKLLPADPRGRYGVLQWLMFQMGSIGPMLGQAHHFLQYAPEDIEYARNRYRNEANRLYGVVDRRLGENPYLAGDDYTHRRHRGLAVDPLPRAPGRRARRVSELRALVRPDRCAAGGAARHRDPRRPAARSEDRQAGLGDDVRRQAVRARASGGLRQRAGAGRRRRVTVAAGCCSGSGSRAASGR